MELFAQRVLQTVFNRLNMRFLNEIKHEYKRIKDWIDGEQGYDMEMMEL